MNIELITHISDFTVEQDMIRETIDKNLSGKLSSYLQKYSDHPIRVEVTVSRDTPKNEKTKSTSSGKAVVIVNGDTYRSDRENFENLQELINHLFDHLKLQMSK